MNQSERTDQNADPRSGARDVIGVDRQGAEDQQHPEEPGEVVEYRRQGAAPEARVDGIGHLRDADRSPPATRCRRRSRGDRSAAAGCPPPWRRRRPPRACPRRGAPRQLRTPASSRAALKIAGSGFRAPAPAEVTVPSSRPSSPQPSRTRGRRAIPVRDGDQAQPAVAQAAERRNGVRIGAEADCRDQLVDADLEPRAPSRPGRRSARAGRRGRPRRGPPGRARGSRPSPREARPPAARRRPPRALDSRREIQGGSSSTSVPRASRKTARVIALILPDGMIAGSRTRPSGRRTATRSRRRSPWSSRSLIAIVVDRVADRAGRSGRPRGSTPESSPGRPAPGCA